MRDDETALVRRLRDGDEDACREFVEAHRDRIITVVARVAGAGADAEDLAQEAFLKAFGAMDRFDGRSALFTWLYRIAVNTARDDLARRRRRPAVPLEGPEGTRVDPVDPSETPKQAYERHERAAIVRDALDRLPEPFRTTLILREMEGHSYEEVATILGVSIGTVESRIFRARCKLRALLGKEPP
ncbi:MAG: sigma-70 family RNA polymerase sigma factor [Planctomycetota bacterium]|jgi:RNA polymerase sigma-70 factor (ECF subfamily)